MLEVDVDSLTGVCAICGPVKVKRKRRSNGTLRFACKVAEARWLGPNYPVGRRRDELGLSVADVAALIARQGGACAVCGDELDRAPGSRRTHLDHDHSTMRVRGVLCLNCNIAIGRLKDSPRRARLAADYLERHAQAA